MRARRTVSVRRVILASAIASSVAAATAAGSASAKYLDLRASLLAGGQIGDGTGGATRDFFRETRGPALGLEVGLRLTVVDLSFRFLQMVGADGRKGTLSTIPMLGLALELPIDGKRGSDRRRLLLRPGVGVGFGFGTPGPVDPPLSSDQISGKGVMALGRVGCEWMFNPFFGVGGELQGGYHYFFGGTGLLNGSDQSTGWQLAAFATATAHVGI